MSTQKLSLGATLLTVALLSPMVADAAVSMPSSARGSSLYYSLGGSDPAARAPNPSSMRLRLGLGGSARLNYSCGKFDVQASIQDTLNSLKNMDDVLMNAVRAAIAALPMYILQRAQPGLYEIVQTYIQKARDLVNLSFESCEEMEAQIKDGKNPYDKWVTLAMGEQWKEKAAGGGSVVSAKQAVQTDSGKHGLNWIFGSKKYGGSSQDPVRIVADLVLGAYNLTMVQPTTASPTANYASTNSRLAKAFPTPKSASDFAVDTVGDMEIATCDDPVCPPKGTSTGTGLSKKFEEEIPVAQGQLNAVMSANVPTATALETASAPGVLITRDLVDAVRTLPKPEQAIAYGRLSQEVALARTVDRALLIRQMLLTGKTIPAATTENVIAVVDAKLDDLNKAIDSLMYEARVRRELVSTSAGTLLQTYQAARSSSAAIPSTRPADTRPLTNGKVQ
jgi:integrating conjugative element protein (TIGR03755 family)